MNRGLIACGVISAWMFLAAAAEAQDKKLDRIRVRRRICVVDADVALVR